MTWAEQSFALFRHHHLARLSSRTDNAATQFAALKAYHESVGLPFALYQLDTWCESMSRVLTTNPLVSL